MNDKALFEMQKINLLRINSDEEARKYFNSLSPEMQDELRDRYINQAGKMFIELGESIAAAMGILASTIRPITDSISHFAKSLPFLFDSDGYKRHLKKERHRKRYQRMIARNYDTR